MVARKLFADNGFHGTGVAQLAAESGIKVGQIYRDFADKEAIVAEIVESDLSRFLHEAELAQAVESADVPAIRAWVLAFTQCRGSEESQALIPEILAEAARNDRIATIAQAITRRVRTALVKALAALAPRPDQVEARARLAELILTMGAGLMHRRIADRDFDEPAAQAELLRLIDERIDRMLAPAAPVSGRNSHCSFMTID